MLSGLRLYLKLRPDLNRLKELARMNVSINVLGQSLLTVLHMANILSAVVPATGKFYVAAGVGFLQIVLSVLAHYRNPDGSPAALPYALSDEDLAAYKQVFASKASKMILILACGGMIGAPSLAAAEVPDTFVSTGAVTNFSAPYHPAPYFAAGTLVNSSGSALPTFAAVRYELYRDASGKPAYAGLASVKTVFYQKGRLFLFADASFGGAGTVTSISSAFQAGGGAGYAIAKHWQIVVEPQARRIPALANGTEPAFLAGIAYTFNRPK